MFRSLSSLVLLALCGCTSAPPAFPARTSPSLREVGPSPAVSYTMDVRSAVDVVGDVEPTDGSFVPRALARFDASGRAEEVTPRFRNDAAEVFGVVYRDGGDAWIAARGPDGPGTVHHLRAGAWERFTALDCGLGASVEDGLILLDAAGPTEAYALRRVAAFDAPPPILCRFDGDGWSVEDLAFEIDTIVSIAGGWVALTTTHQILRRASAATGWTEVSLGAPARGLRAVPPHAALVDLDWSATDVVLVELATERVLSGQVRFALDGTLFSIDSSSQEVERCGRSWLYGDYCTVETDWVQYVLYRGVGADREEVGHLNLSRDAGDDLAPYTYSFAPGSISFVESLGGQRMWSYP